MSLSPVNPNSVAEQAPTTVSPVLVTPIPSLSLIQKLSTAGPRYTSYPTAAEFGPSVDGAIFDQHLTDYVGVPQRQPPGVSLYVHVPFCPSLCYFCACNKVITQDRVKIRSFLDSLLNEIRYRGSQVGSHVEVQELHWGGGSPSYLTPEEISFLFTTLNESFPQWSPEAERSIELDPRTTAPEKLHLLRDLGFNRVSFGVQDFNPDVQRAVNREQSLELVQSLMERCRSLSFSGVNIDIIYGLPLQTRESMEVTIETLLALRPDRVAAYGYAHVPWMKKVQKTLEKLDLPTPTERAELYRIIVGKLTGGGYLHLGMDHFAVPHDSLVRAQQNGTLTRNFMGYTIRRAEALLGFGPSAISSLPFCYAQNLRELDDYQAAISQKQTAIERGVLLSSDDIIRGHIIRSILCFNRLSVGDVENEYGITFDEYFPTAADALAQHAADGLLSYKNREIVLTTLGRLFARNICMIFDAKLAKYQQNSQRAFSQTV